MPSRLLSRTATFRFRRAADFTALRLGRAVLGYLALMMAIITLAPFRFQLRPAHGISLFWTPTDLVMNILMFVPFGFVYQLTRPRGAPTDWPRVVLLGAALSGTIELMQLFAPTRFTSPIDLATNTTGAALGAWLFANVATRVRDDEAMQTFALELPLMGLVYLLVPLCWLIGLGSEGDARRWLVLPIAAIAGAIIGTVHAAYLVPRRIDSRVWLVSVVIGWVLVALVPGTRGDRDLIASGATLALGIAMLRTIATGRAAARDRVQRFELPTLRLVLPLYVGYLVLSSLWPPSDMELPWQWTAALTPAGVTLTQPLVYRALEHVAAFTLVGYISAEFYGRDTRSFGASLPRLLAWTGFTSLLLQCGRGLHPTLGASLSLFVFTQLAAVYGGWLYVLQRAHVQALVARRALLEQRKAQRENAATTAARVP